MHKTDADSNVANLFSDGDASVPRAGTLVDAAIMNAIQEELCNLVTDSSIVTPIALVKGTWDQVKTALHTLYLRPGINPSYGQAIPNGDIIIARSDSGHANGGKQRVIFKSDGAGGSQIWLTINAFWSASGAQWIKDAASAPAMAVAIAAGSIGGVAPYGAIAAYRYAGAGPFTDADWKSVNVLVAMTLTADFINTAGTTSPAAYSYTLDGRVCLQGSVSQSSGAPGAVITTMPAVARKTTDQRFPASYIDAGVFKFCTVKIASNGQVTTDCPISAAQLTFDGISYQPD